MVLFKFDSILLRISSALSIICRLIFSAFACAFLADADSLSDDLDAGPISVIAVFVPSI